MKERLFAHDVALDAVVALDAGRTSENIEIFASAGIRSLRYRCL